MTPGGFHSLNAAWLGLLLIPLVLFYFLKLRRPHLQVPSLVLWRQVMEDRRVNSPFQRFKRNLLLLLQLLLLLLIILAALRPYWRGDPNVRRRVPVLVDCSASMGALDKPGGTSRLDAAKKRVREMIDGLAPDQELCLISFAGTARRCCGFTNSKRLLREALDTMQTAPLSADLEEALRLAQGLARSEPFEEVILFSDGNVPARVNVDLSFALNYQQIPAGGPNVGITALAAHRDIDGEWNVFMQLEGSPEAESNATVELIRNGDTVGSQRVTLARARGKRMVFEVGGGEAAVLEARLVPDGFDSLAVDNAAQLNLPTIRTVRVFVPTDLVTFRRALVDIPGLDIWPKDGDSPDTGTFDLVITDRVDDLARPTRTRLTVGLIPPQLKELLKIDNTGTQVIDWRRDAALLRHVELSDVLILDRPRFAGDADETDLENMGFVTLAYGDVGPLILRRNNGITLDFAVLFHTDRSTLPYRVGFPILAANVVNAAVKEAGLAEVAGTNGLLTPSETALTAIDHLEFNERLDVRAAGAPLLMDRELWPWLVMIALAVLLLEWWYFHRKAG